MKQLQSLHWHVLYGAASEFIALARQYHFCEELLPEIERRLYECSPFPKHHE